LEVNSFDEALQTITTLASEGRGYVATTSSEGSAALGGIGSSDAARPPGAATTAADFVGKRLNCHLVPRPLITPCSKCLWVVK